MKPETGPDNQVSQENDPETVLSRDSDDSTDSEDSASEPVHSGLILLRQLFEDKENDEQRVSAGNLVKIRNLLKDTSVITARYENGKTALHEAVERGLDDAAEELIKSADAIGAKDDVLKARDDDERQPLHIACLEGHVKLVKLLMRYGVDIDAMGYSQATPLDDACWKGRSEIVDLLIKKGSNTQVVDKDGWSPLYSASQYGKSAVVERLLEADKSNINAIENLNGWTALHTATYHNHGEVVSILLGHGAMRNIQDDKGCAPLMIATERQTADIMRKLLSLPPENGDIQLETPNPLGRTPLLLASIDGFLDGACLLIDAGANCNARSYSSKSTPLIAAASWGYLGIVRALLGPEVNTDVNSTDGVDQTALHIACSQNRTEIVQLLLQRDGVDIHLQDNQGQTALHLACEEGNESIVKALLEKKAVVDTKDHEGKTPLHLATGAQGSTQPEPQDHTDDEKRREFGRQSHVVRLLFDHGADSRAKTNDDETALHMAAACGDRETIQIVLEHMKSADLLARDKQGMTALGSAFKKRKLVALEILLESDDMKTADFGENEFADDALLWAAGDLKNHPIARQLLRKKPRAPKPPKSENWSAIEWAAYDQLPQVLSALISNSAGSEGYKSGLKAALEMSLESAKTLDEEADWNKLSQVLWLLITASERTAELEVLVKSVFDSLQKIQRQRQTLPEPQNPQKTQKTQKQSEDLEKVGPSGHHHRFKEKSQELRKGSTGHDTQEDGTKQQDPQNHQTDNLGVIKDILRDPPFMSRQIHKDSEKYDSPEAPEDDLMKEALNEFEANVVQFYKGKDVSETDQRSRSVHELIYNEGPTKIMQTAVTMRTNIANLSSIDNESSKPEIIPKFTWIHLPATNMDWMNDLLTRVMKDTNYTTRQYHELRSFFQDSWIEVPDPKTSSRIMRPRTVVSRKEKESGEARDREGNLEERNDGKTRRSKDKPPVAATAIYMPFLSFSTHCKELAELDIVHTGESQSGKYDTVKSKTDENKTGENKTGDSNFDEINHINNETSAKQISSKHEKFRMRKENYKKLLAAYSECSGVHRSPTLDEWYYHFADDLSSTQDKHRRNETQVITRFLRDDQSTSDHTKVFAYTEGNVNLEEHSKSSGHPGNSSESVKNDLNPPAGNGLQPDAGGMDELDMSSWVLLRVNQLWVWTIENKWLITASSCSFDDSHGALVAEILQLINKQADNGSSLSQPESPVDMSRLIVEYCIRLYEKRPKAASKTSISQAFSNHMNKLGRDETSLFEDFSIQTELQKNQPPSKGVKITRNDRISKSSTIAPQHDPSQFLSEKSLKVLTKSQPRASYVEEIKKAIKRAEGLYCDIKDFRDELNILKSVAQHQRTVQKGLPGKEVKDSDLLATYVVNDLRELDNVAGRIQSAVNTTLSLQQSEIANFQAALAVEQAASAAEQGKVLMVFTFATLLFLPLSFLTSLFALDVASFLQTPRWAFAVIFLVSAAVSLVVALAAIYSTYIAEFSKRVCRVATTSAKTTTGSRERISLGEPSSTDTAENSTEHQPQSTTATESHLRELRHLLKRRGENRWRSAV